jgi:nucleoside-diphosphate-sugar epimerase/NAD-dependent dihydropyrimidine dehydrogenase PreA subunit
VLRRRTRISIDYRRCGDGVGVDPRECALCLRACAPAVFLLHQTLGAKEVEPFDPKKWRVTPLWPSLCTRCGECVAACPQQAITVAPAADRVAPHTAVSSNPGNTGEAPANAAADGVTTPRPTRDFARCLVIGGSGMLGFEMVRQLVEAGKQVRILDLQPSPHPLCEALVGDIRSRSDVQAACAGLGSSDVVFQTAAAVWDVGTPPEVYEQVNVDGNRLVIDVCRELGIGRLVYTSSIDVVVDGRRPIVDGDECLPYPSRIPVDPYSRTKIEAEKMILDANGAKLATCALRPVGMYGPRDRYHLGNVLAMARRGNKLRLGSGKACFSHAYSENVAHAHVLAAAHLFPGSLVAGRAYFVGDNYTAGNFFDFMEPFLEALDLPVPRWSIPYPLAYGLAFVAEKVAPRSNFNRFSVIQTCVDHTYRHDRAERDFGYRPIVSAEEAFRRTIADIKGSMGLGEAGE